MEEGQSKKGNRKTGILWGASLVATAVAVFFATMQLSSFLPGFGSGKAGRMQELVTEMRIALARTAENEKCAVIAFNDEDARNYADQARVSSEWVERKRRLLDGLVGKEGDANERELMKKFNAAWSTLRRTDDTLLESATQNTNQKALELSDTICAELLQKLHADLANLTAKVTPPAHRYEMEKYTGQAEAAALKIALLQRRHVGAPSVAEKRAIETSIQNESQKAGAVLKKLESMTGRKSSPFIRGAMTGFTQFMQVNEEIIRLSNINSNRSSAEISLGSRRLADAECDKLLRELGAAVGNNPK